MAEVLTCFCAEIQHTAFAVALKWVLVFGGCSMVATLLVSHNLICGMAGLTTSSSLRDGNSHSTIMSEAVWCLFDVLQHNVCGIVLGGRRVCSVLGYTMILFGRKLASQVPYLGQKFLKFGSVAHVPCPW